MDYSAITITLNTIKYHDTMLHRIPRSSMNRNMCVCSVGSQTESIKCPLLQEQEESIYCH